MKIQKRITITFMLILFLSLFTTSIISYFVVKKIVIQNALSNLDSISQSEFHVLEGIVVQNRERLDLVRSRTQMRINLKSYNQTHEKKYQDGMNRILNDDLASIPDFKEISIIDPEKIIVSSTNRDIIGMEYTNEQCLTRVDNEGVVNIFSLNRNSDLNIYLCGSIVLDNEIIGMIIITVSGDKITKVVTDYTLLGETGYALLVFKNSEADRHIISIRRRRGELSDYSYVDFNSIGEITKKTIFKETGIYCNIEDYEHQKMCAVVSYNEDLDIGLSVRMAYGEVLKPVRIFQSVLIILFVVFLVIMFVFTLINSKLITKPVVELIQLAEQIGAGDLEQRIKVDSDGEIGMLGRVFNRMAENLKRDINKRECAERSLRKSEKRFRNTLDNMMEGAQIMDHDLTYVYLNDVAIKHSQKRQDELIGKKFVDVWPGIEKTTLYEIIQKCLHEKKPMRLQNKFEFSDGKIGWFNLSVQPVPEGIFILSMDMTEHVLTQKRLEEYQQHLEDIVKERTDELQAVNEELEAFAYSVSHDLRAPLRSIDGFTEILLEDYCDKFDDEGKRLGGVIRKNANKMGKLIDDLLAFSRLGRASMSISEIDMKNMVNAIYHEATNPDERKRINFSIEDIPNVQGDPNMFRQVWMNIISNAIKFSSKCKRAIISVSSYEDKNNIIFVIKDNGAGFDIAYKDKLFGVFQRLHSEREFPGTGVGLALVQRIIHKHGGKIWAEGEVGKGATFYFSLPKNKPIDIIVQSLS